MKVILTHKEGYSLGGIMAAMTVAFAVMCFFNPVAINIAMACLCCAVSAFGFYMASCTETLQEAGITLKSPFRNHQISWEQLRRVEIAKPSAKDTAKLILYIDERKQPIAIDYTKRTLQCIRSYYGEPDADRYGKPPELY